MQHSQLKCYLFSKSADLQCKKQCLLDKIAKAVRRLTLPQQCWSNVLRMCFKCALYMRMLAYNTRMGIHAHTQIRTYVHMCFNVPQMCPRCASDVPQVWATSAHLGVQIEHRHIRLCANMHIRSSQIQVDPARSSQIQVDPARSSKIIQPDLTRSSSIPPDPASAS